MRNTTCFWNIFASMATWPARRQICPWSVSCFLSATCSSVSFKHDHFPTPFCGPWRNSIPGCLEVSMSANVSYRPGFEVFGCNFKMKKNKKKARFSAQNHNVLPSYTGCLIQMTVTLTAISGKPHHDQHQQNYIHASAVFGNYQRARSRAAGQFAVLYLQYIYLAAQASKRQTIWPLYCMRVPGSVSIFLHGSEAWQVHIFQRIKSFSPLDLETHYLVDAKNCAIQTLVGPLSARRV